ncbi:hypothetical protein SS50377_25646 [Spironucleus salmonicida]|uniref:NHL repeat-containing protein n=1 Tax=Spironucleus salmonicida TaxID=348837 RepID=V6M7L4_9EUKA|nr:hypothetical protein SS50377_25646 [Spironucleus salmonicida]|eukprot:EST49454.1 hypothetical protein SS50377_10202 [Spironucleus salmonicida]
MNRPFFSQTYTGTPIVGYQDGPLYNAQFSRPFGITFSSGDFYVTDRSAPTSIRKINKQGVTSLKWSNTNQELLHPTCTIERNGFYFIADRGHDKIRYLVPETGTLKTLLLQNIKAPNQLCFLNEDLLVLDQSQLLKATLHISKAEVTVLGVTIITQNLKRPEGLLYHQGNIYISNTLNHQILKLSLDSGQIEVFAGNRAGFTDGPALQAQFRSPTALSALNDRIFVSDRDNHTIRVIRNGIVESLSVGGARGYQNGAYDVMKFSEPHGLCAIQKGFYIQLFVCDVKNACIRVLANARSEDAFDDLEHAEEGFTTNQQEDINESEQKFVKIDESQNQDLSVNLQTQDIQLRDFSTLNKQKKQLKKADYAYIHPYAAFTQIMKNNSFDMVNFQRLFAASKFLETKDIIEFLCTYNQDLIYPLAMAYFNYYEVLIEAINKNVQLDKNLKTILVLRNLLVYGLLTYKAQLFRSLISTPNAHSFLLCTLSKSLICTKTRISVNGEIIDLTKNGEFRNNKIQYGKKMLFQFEIQLTYKSTDKEDEMQFEIDISSPVLSLQSKTHYFGLQKFQTYQQGIGKIDLQVNGIEAVKDSKLAFQVNVKVGSKKQNIKVRFSGDQAVKVQDSVSRIMQLQQQHVLITID